MTATDTPAAVPRPAERKGYSGTTIVIAVVATIAVTLGAVFALRAYLFPSAFRPVELSAREEVRLNDKLQVLGIATERVRTESAAADPAAPLEPVAYSESSADRLVEFSERELNSLIARNTDLASRLAIDLSSNLASARLLIPMDPDFPMIGGKTLRINAGLELAYEAERPVVILRGISVMGVPIPSAWLGNLKNVDLVNQFGGGPGFWNGFAAGVEFIEVADGQLRIKLKE